MKALLGRRGVSSPISRIAGCWLWAFFPLLTLGCVDLTEPWKQGGTGGSKADALELADAPSLVGTGGAFEGNLGSGGRAGTDGAQSSEGGRSGAIDVALEGAGGGLDDATVDGGEGVDLGDGESVDLGPSATDGNADTSIAGSGGVGSGGAGGRRDAGSGSGGTRTGGNGGRASGGAGGRGGAGGSATGGASTTRSGGNAGRSGTGGAGSGGVATGGSAKADAGTDANLPDGLVLYYPCEHAVGTSLPDESGHAYDGTLPTDTESYRFATGKVGKALHLVESSKGYVRIPIEVFRDATDLTIAIWINVTEPSPALDRVFDIGIDAKLGQNRETGTTYMTFLLSDPYHHGEHSFSSTKDGYTHARKIEADASAIRSDEWRHIAVTIGSGRATLYVDAKSVDTETSVLAPKDLGAIDYAYLGRSQFTEEPYLDALIDEVRVYDRALSADEIRSLFDYAR